MNHVFEWYGFAAGDGSEAASDSAANRGCPFVPPDCTKTNGACSIATPSEVVTICPKRLYFDDYRILRDIADEAFGAFQLRREPNGLPTLVPGKTARSVAASTGEYQVGVFGKGFGTSGEIKLPPAMPDGPRYSVDFVLVIVDPSGELKGFVPVEVQTIDTTNSYDDSIKGLQDGRHVVPSGVGLNWENVSKRILPQLIVKGLMLQGERLCTTGIYFVTPEPVFQRIMRRLGGADRLRRIPQQPSTITFHRYEQALPAHTSTPVPLRRLAPVTVSTSDMSLAFISPENLPPSGSYEELIVQKL